MGQTLTEKILSAHLVEGEMVKGSEIGIRIDQTLTQDATGTMAYLEFEAMGVPRVKTERSVAYIDHNTLQNGFEIILKQWRLLFLLLLVMMINLKMLLMMEKMAFSLKMKMNYQNLY